MTEQQKEPGHGQAKIKYGLKLLKQAKCWALYEKDHDRLKELGKAFIAEGLDEQ